MNILKGLIQGKVNTKKEVLISNYAKVYDKHNENLFLGNVGNKSPQKGTQIKRVFTDLKNDCHRNGARVPASVNHLERIALDNNGGRLSDKQALSQIRTICLKHGVSTTALDLVESRINLKDGLGMPYFMQQKAFDPLKSKSPPLNNYFALEPKHASNKKKQGLNFDFLKNLTKASYKHRRRGLKKTKRKFDSSPILGRYLKGAK